MPDSITTVNARKRKPKTPPPPTTEQRVEQLETTVRRMLAFLSGQAAIGELFFELRAELRDRKVGE